LVALDNLVDFIDIFITLLQAGWHDFLVRNEQDLLAIESVCGMAHAKVVNRFCC
jgi:hypothetical protein